MEFKSPAELVEVIELFRQSPERTDLADVLALAMVVASDVRKASAMAIVLDKARLIERMGGTSMLFDVPRLLANALARSIDDEETFRRRRLTDESHRERVEDFPRTRASAIARQIAGPQNYENLIPQAKQLILEIQNESMAGVLSLQHQWVAAIIYGYLSLSEVSTDSDESELTAEIVVAQLVMSATLDEDEFQGLQNDTEQLLAELTRVAHDAGTPAELAEAAFSHVRDGFALLRGPSGEPREKPPASRTIYGWITDAIEIIAAAHPVEDEGAHHFLQDITSSPAQEPQGLQRALETAATSSFAKDALARAKEGTLEGIRTGTEQLFARVIAHPARTITAAVSLGVAVHQILAGYPWLTSAVRAMVRLVHEL